MLLVLLVKIYGLTPTIADLTSADQVAKIRRLLKGPADSSPNGGPHMVLSINHQEAKIYQTEMKGSTPERVVPHHGLGHTNHVHSNHDYSDHIQKPNHKAYFETITNLLKDADKILIFGEGSGSSSAMDLYVAWLSEHHKPLAEKIQAAVKIDQSHMTEGELLARAREIYLH